MIMDAWDRHLCQRSYQRRLSFSIDLVLIFIHDIRVGEGHIAFNYLSYLCSLDRAAEESKVFELSQYTGSMTMQVHSPLILHYNS
jgi:hypothetical protein